MNLPVRATDVPWAVGPVTPDEGNWRPAKRDRAPSDLAEKALLRRGQLDSPLVCRQVRIDVRPCQRSAEDDRLLMKVRQPFGGKHQIPHLMAQRSTPSSGRGREQSTLEIALNPRNQRTEMECPERNG